MIEHQPARAYRAETQRHRLARLAMVLAVVALPIKSWAQG